MNNLVIVTARQNSQRLRNKNLLKIGKIPLVERAIKFALSIENKNNIILSTDSKIIMKFAKKHKIIFLGLRPSKLSSSTSNTAEACIYELRKYESYFKKKIDNIVLLQPTSPFRSIKFFNKTYKIFKSNFLPTISVKPICGETIFKKKNKKTQLVTLLKNYYRPDGNLYIIKKKDLFKNKSFVHNSCNLSFQESKKNSIDIDNIYDFERANAFNKNN
jgi:CMP-N-acetylneuraminic acid synthetase